MVKTTKQIGVTLSLPIVLFYQTKQDHLDKSIVVKSNSDCILFTII